MKAFRSPRASDDVDAGRSFWRVAADQMAPPEDEVINGQQPPVTTTPSKESPRDIANLTTLEVPDLDHPGCCGCFTTGNPEDIVSLTRHDECLAWDTHSSHRRSAASLKNVELRV